MKNVRRLGLTCAIGGLLAGIGLGPSQAPAAASPIGQTRPAVADPWVRRVDRTKLRARYPIVKPPPTRPTRPAPPPVRPAPRPRPQGPAVPAICRQRAAIVCASKKERTLRYYERGKLWLSTPVAFGRRGYETPAGLWSVRIKDANAWSYEFHAPMPFSLEYDLARGIYIHYSATFARIGPTYIGSHGCINIGNYATAKRLFQRVPLGAAVYVY